MEGDCQVGPPGHSERAGVNPLALLEPLAECLTTDFLRHGSGAADGTLIKNNCVLYVWGNGPVNSQSALIRWRSKVPAP